MNLRKHLWIAVILTGTFSLSCFASVPKELITGGSTLPDAQTMSSKKESRGGDNKADTMGNLISSSVEPQKEDKLQNLLNNTDPETLKKMGIDPNNPKLAPDATLRKLAEAVDPEFTDRLLKWKNMSKNDPAALKQFDEFKTKLQDAMAARGMSPEEISREMYGFETMDRSRFRLLGYSANGVEALDKYNQWIIDHPYAWPNSQAKNSWGMCGDTVLQRHFLLDGQGAGDLNKYNSGGYKWDDALVRSGAYTRLNPGAEPIAGDYAMGANHAASYATMPNGKSLWIAQWPGQGNIQQINMGYEGSGRLTGMTSGNFPSQTMGTINFAYLPRKLVNWRTNDYPEPASYYLPLRI